MGDVLSPMACDEKSEESVRKYPALYDKSCAEFKEKLKKELAWNGQAKEVGLESGKLV